MPQLSIIVPVYKVEQYLRECVDSILSQTYSDYELILVDDGSPDRCGEICDEYQKAFPQKIKVVHKENGGLSDARNAGLEIAVGKYIGFVDSDDKIRQDMYLEMISAAETNNADVVFSQVLTWEEELRNRRQNTHNRVFDGNQALSRIYKWQESVSVWSKIFRKESIGNIRFRKGIINEDFPFVSEVLLHAKKVIILDKGYYLYRVTPGSLTNVFRPNFFDIFDNVDYVDNLIPCDKRAVRIAFERYALTMHIMSGTKIVKNKKNSEYKEWLRKNRKYILKSWKTLLFDTELTARWRVKALFSFLRLGR